MKSTIRTASAAGIVGIALFTLLLAAPALTAQSYGRYVLTLTDEAGEAIVGATVRATCPELTEFEQSVVTDKRGRATFTFVDATKVYLLHIDHEGYRPAEFTIKAALRGVNRQTVALPAAGSEPEPETAPTAPPPAASLTPAQATFNEGVVALQGEDLATAEAKFLAALELEPELAPAYSGLAGIYLAQDKNAEAAATADKLLALAPDDLRGLRLSYEANNRLGNKAAAKAALERIGALGDSGDVATMLYNEGAAALKVGDRATAQARFEEALATNPELAPAHAAMATVHVAEKRYAEAAQAAEAALALEPDNLQALRVRFDAYRLLKDTAKADAALSELARVDPDGVFDWLYESGVELFDHGDMAGAAAQLEGAIKLHPQDPNALYRLGLAYVNLDQKAKATETLEAFLAVSPDHPEASVAREMLAYLK
jgi:tetratricopeptide (TPR) repeat protein